MRIESKPMDILEGCGPALGYRHQASAQRLVQRYDLRMLHHHPCSPLAPDGDDL